MSGSPNGAAATAGGPTHTVTDVGGAVGQAGTGLAASCDLNGQRIALPPHETTEQRSNGTTNGSGNPKSGVDAAHVLDHTGPDMVREIEDGVE
jgi:hypothetical protein